MKKFDSINVIPFIDIMLVLLAIVLTTATFISNGQLDVKVPRASAPATAEPAESIEIAIDDAHQFFLDGQPMELSMLGERLQRQDPEVTVRLRVDEASRFQYFVQIIDLLRQNSLDNVAIVTRAED